VAAFFEGIEMKKYVILCGLGFLISLFSVAAHAETAQVINNLCTVKASSGANISRLFDGNEATVFQTKKEKNPFIEFTLEEGTVCCGIYLVWPQTPPAYGIMVLEGEEWVWAAYGSEHGFVHDYIPLAGYNTFRLCPKTGGITLKLSEVKLLSPGVLPEDIQIWEPPHTKTDMLLLVAHPDDEFVYMGGLIPYYAGEMKMRVTVAYMTCATARRRSELLNGLWHAGLRHYPVIGNFYDKYTNSLNEAYNVWGKRKARTFIRDLIDRFNPDVMITHDILGEYGHGAHRLCADAVTLSVLSGETSVQKLYIHLYKENTIHMDWSIPLETFRGKEAIQVAREAFAYHHSQQKGTVRYRGSIYKIEVYESGVFDSGAFGLYYSTVGPDRLKNDMLENIKR
jgi:hypothetical protein